MKPVHRNRRLAIFLCCSLVVILGAVLLLTALQENKQFFRHPSDVVHTSYIQGERDIRVGGLVVEGSIVQSGGLNIQFGVTDFVDADQGVRPLVVVYDKVLPDLFREGQGVVITGRLDENGLFIANNVLAKHDENYMPKMPEKVDYGDGV